jgi:Ca2+-binding RTX toxin-like protein
VGLIGLSSGGEVDEPVAEDDDSDSVPMQEVPLAEQDMPMQQPMNVLAGTAQNDELLGDTTYDGIDAGDGDDFIASFGSTGAIDGGAGDDTIALTTGEGTLTGGEGADVFFVVGDEDSNVTTKATIKDFDPTQDSLTLLPQQSVVASGDVAISPTTVELKVNEIETDNGSATELKLVARSGFEQQVASAGLSSVTLEGVKPAELRGADFRIGPDTTVNVEDQTEFLKALSKGISDYDSFSIYTPLKDDILDNGTSNAIFGLGGDDVITGSIGPIVPDIFGGSGDDTITSDVLGSGSVLDGGAGDDMLFASASDTLVGGEGTDTFNVIAYDFEPNMQPNVEILDFDLGAETLKISAFYPASFFDVPDGTEITGEATIELVNATKNGVTGTQITTT